MSFKNNYDAYTNEELISLYQGGNEDIKEYFFNKNKALIYGLIKRYQNHYNKEELFQIGCVGFVKAFNQFDLQYGVKFSTYAVPIILGEIKKHFRDEGNIHITRSLKENYYKILNAKDELSQILLKDPTVYELSKYTGISAEDIILSLDANRYVSSLDEVVYESDGNDISLMEICNDKKSNKDYCLQIALNEEFHILNDMEKKLLYYRYYKDLKQTEISKHLQVSQVQVSRLEKRALQKLRNRFN